MLSSLFANFVDGNNVRMVEAGGGFGFSVEAFDFGLTSKDAGANHLHCDAAIEAHLPGAVNYAHPAASNLVKQFVVPKLPGQSRKGSAGGSERSHWDLRQSKG